MTEADYLRLTRDGYDLTASAYAERFHNHLHDKPLDLAMLSAFAGLIGGGRVLADIGCGTGVTTAMFAQLGLNVCGIDLSPNMIAEARRINPGLAFRVGSMTSLDLDDASVDAVCAWYSTIHLPDELLPQAFSEFERILRPGGHVLLAFQVGDQPRILTSAFGEDVALTFHRRRPAAVAETLAAAALQLYAQLVREADDDGLESTPQAYLIARKL
ncbi:class I SAM-dependent methyltransferase [Mycobacterium sp.]|uniref:class I SAM-dependent methyltransferase n=1 Tax=Mycobacterium sp. TaxID=1785 RepID=UPI002D97A003|nr:class I SAM-dependent methyltransferase [Mycobacterium sp.]